MAEEKVTLEVLIDARKAKQGAQEYVDASKKAEGAAKDLTAAQEKQTEAMSRGDAILVRVTRRLINYFGVYQGIRLVRESITTLAQFEETMVVVQGVAQATAADLERLTETARRFGAITRFSATEAGQALLELSKAGFTVNESIAALPSILTLAQSSQLGLSEAADISTKAIRQFKLEAADAMRIVDDFVVVANKSNADVRGIGEAMKFVGPIASSFGLSIEEVAAAIGVLSDSGIQGAMAGTNLRQMLSTLVQPTKETKEVLQRLGVSMKDLSPSTANLTNILTKLKEANLGAEEATKAFTTRSASAVLILSSNVAKLKELEEAQRKSKGEAQRLADMMDKTLVGGFKNLQSAVEEFMLQVGDSGLGQVVSKATLLFTDMFRVLSGSTTGSQQFVSGAQALATTLKTLVTVAETWLALKIGSSFIAAARGLAIFIREAAMATKMSDALRLSMSLLKGAAFLLATVAVAAFNDWLRQMRAVEEATQDVLKAVQDLTTAQKLLAGAASPMERFERSADVAKKSVTVVQEELKKLEALMDDFFTDVHLPKIDLGTEEEIKRIRELIAQQRAMTVADRMDPLFGPDSFAAQKQVNAVEALSRQLDILIGNLNRTKRTVSETFEQLRLDVGDADKYVKDRIAETGEAPQAFIDAQLKTLTALRNFMDKVIGDEMLRGMGEAAGITEESLADVAKRIEDLDGKARKASVGTKNLNTALEDGGDAGEAFGKGTQTAAAAATQFVQTLEKQLEAAQRLTPEQQRAKLGLEAIGIAFRLSTEEMNRFLLQTAPLLAALGRIQDAAKATADRTEAMKSFFDALAKVQADQQVALILNDREAEQKRQLIALDELLAEKAKMPTAEREKFIAALQAEFDKLNQLNDIKKEELRLREQRFEKLRKEGEAMKEALTAYDDMLERYKDEVQLHKDLAELRGMSINIGKRQIALVENEAGERKFMIQVVQEESLALEKLQALREAEKRLRESGVAADDIAVLIDVLAKEIDAAQKAREVTDSLAQIARNSALAFENFFNSIVFGAADAKEALRQLTMQLLQMVATQMFFQPLSEMLGAGFAGIFEPFFKAQHGAVLAGPTVIPASTMGGSPVLAAEAGRPEAIMPLARTPSGDLGVRTVGGSAPVIVHANFYGVRNMDEFRRSKRHVMSTIGRGVRKVQETSE